MEQEYVADIIKDLENSDMILVGLGEEFDAVRQIRHSQNYEKGRDLLLDSSQSSLFPAWQNLYREELEDSGIANGLNSLCKRIAEKNYFVVSVSTNDEIRQIPWKNNHLVMPCGSAFYMQCTNDCECNLQRLGTDMQDNLKIQLLEWRGKMELDSTACPDVPVGMGFCPKCGKAIELNNVYSGNYDENGYLDSWNLYTRWLQGTLNRNLVVLELGVGMKYPSVIRFPFEKIVYFNQKAKFYRINENLYQLTEELAGKGVGIAKNAIDWLQNLC